MARDYAPEIVLRDIDTITPYVHNNKKHPEEQIAKIAASIEEFGWDQPLVVDGNGIIIKGHGRHLAARKLGLKTVPVVVRTDLNPAQIKAARIADNRVGISDWDLDALVLELKDLGDLGYDLSLTGFDDKELDAFLADPLVLGLTDANDAPEPPADPVVCPECGHKFKP